MWLISLRALNGISLVKFAEPMNAGILVSLKSLWPHQGNMSIFYSFVKLSDPGRSTPESALSRAIAPPYYSAAAALAEVIVVFVDLYRICLSRDTSRIRGRYFNCFELADTTKVFQNMHNPSQQESRAYT